MAQEVLGDHVSGIVPSTPTPKPNAPDLNVPVAPVVNLDAPPTPPRLNPDNKNNNAPDSDEQRIYQAKARALEEAIQSKTNISLPNQLNAKPGVANSSPPQTRQEMIERLADVQRQIGSSTSNDPNAAYQTRLSQIQNSLNNGNYSAPSETGAAVIKAGHLPWKSKRKASEAVSPCFRQVDT